MQGKINWDECYAAIFRQDLGALKAVKDVDFTDLDSLIGIEAQKEALLKNTQNFMDGLGGEHALLWGERGCGKSSLVKAVFTHFCKQGLRIIEVGAGELKFLPAVIDEARNSNKKFIIFCDDLSFESGNVDYKFLKPLMEGSIERAPKNALFYATSNRRHLTAETQSDNEDVQISSGELHYADAVQEKISLSDRFGLWISFYQGGFEEYLKIVDFYFKDYALDADELHRAAREFAAFRASRSARTAKQFYARFIRNFKDKK